MKILIAACRTALSIFLVSACVTSVCSAQLIDTEGDVTDQTNTPIGDTTANLSVDGLRIGNSGVGSMEVTGGLDVLNSGFMYLGFDSDSEGSATISGADSLLESDSSIFVGRHGTGTLNVFDGANVTNSREGIVGYSGFGSSGTGTVNVSGMDSLWEHSTLIVGQGGTGLTAGQGGTGTVSVDLGGKLTGSTGRVGWQPGGTGTVNVMGQDANGTKSSWDLTSGLTVGQESTGTVNVLDGGQLTSAGSSSIGRTNGNGTVTVAGDESKWTNSATLSIGSSGAGELNVESGGTVTTGSTIIGSGFSTLAADGVVNVNGTDSLGTGSLLEITGDLDVGVNRSGVLNIESGGRVTATGRGDISAQGGDGSVLVTGDGSELILGGSLNVGSRGTATLDVLDGGFVSSDRSRIGSSSGSDGTATVSGNGSWWENTDSLTVGNGGDAKLLVLDGGAVTSVGGTVDSSSASTSSSFATISGVDSLGVRSSWDATGGTSGTPFTNFTVGGAGQGELNILAGGQVTSTLSFVGFSGPADGTVNVEGSGSRWDNSGDMSIGQFAKGELNVLDGGIVSNGGNGYLGRNNNDLAIGTATVSGAGSQWNNDGDLFVADFGTGTLNISDGGVVSNAEGIISNHRNRTGTVSVSGTGSQWDNSGDLTVGYFGTGVLDINSGGTVNNDNAYVGRDGSSLGAAEGTVNVSGADTSWNTTNDLHVGGNPGDLGKSGVVNISDGTVNVGGTMKLYQPRAVAGATGGVVNFSGGKLDVDTLDLTATDATENFNMTGGRLVVDTILGDFKQEGGTLAAGDTSPGLTDIQGDYNMIAGMIEFDLEGYARGTEFDAIDVSGLAIFNGTATTIEVNYVSSSSFMAMAEDSFQLVNAGGFFGLNNPTFVFTGSSLGPGLGWDTSQFLSTGTIFVAAVPEPSSLTMFGIACAILVAPRRRKSLTNKSKSVAA
jgi:T5SS/PEP-CTERM-associated repeat protein